MLFAPFFAFFKFFCIYISQFYLIHIFYIICILFLNFLKYFFSSCMAPGSSRLQMEEEFPGDRGHAKRSRRNGTKCRGRAPRRKRSSPGPRSGRSDASMLAGSTAGNKMPGTISWKPLQLEQENSLRTVALSHPKADGRLRGKCRPILANDNQLAASVRTSRTGTQMQALIRTISSSHG